MRCCSKWRDMLGKVFFACVAAVVTVGTVTVGTVAVGTADSVSVNVIVADSLAVGVAPQQTHFVRVANGARASRTGGENVGASPTLGDGDGRHAKVFASVGSDGDGDDGDGGSDGDDEDDNDIRREKKKKRAVGRGGKKYGGSREAAVAKKFFRRSHAVAVKKNLPHTVAAQRKRHMSSSTPSGRVAAYEWLDRIDATTLAEISAFTASEWRAYMKRRAILRVVRTPAPLPNIEGADPLRTGDGTQGFSGSVVTVATAAFDDVPTANVPTAAAAAEDDDFCSSFPSSFATSSAVAAATAPTASAPVTMPPFGWPLVLRYLSARTLLTAVERTCTAWQRLSKSGAVWHAATLESGSVTWAYWKVARLGERVRHTTRLTCNVGSRDARAGQQQGDGSFADLWRRSWLQNLRSPSWPQHLAALTDLCVTDTLEAFDLGSTFHAFRDNMSNRTPVGSLRLPMLRVRFASVTGVGAFSFMSVLSAILATESAGCPRHLPSVAVESVELTGTRGAASLPGNPWEAAVTILWRPARKSANDDNAETRSHDGGGDDGDSGGGDNVYGDREGDAKNGREEKTGAAAAHRPKVEAPAPSRDASSDPADSIAIGRTETATMMTATTSTKNTSVPLESTFSIAGQVTGVNYLVLRTVTQMRALHTVRLCHRHPAEPFQLARLCRETVHTLRVLELDCCVDGFGEPLSGPTAPQIHTLIFGSRFSAVDLKDSLDVYQLAALRSLTAPCELWWMRWQLPPWVTHLKLLRVHSTPPGDFVAGDFPGVETLECETHRALAVVLPRMPLCTTLRIKSRLYDDAWQQLHRPAQPVGSVPL